MRSLFVVLVFAVWTGLLLVPVALSVLLTFGGEGAGWMATNLWAPVILWAGGVTLRAERNDALDPTQPYVFVGNHQGYFDVPAAFATLRHRVRFVAKRSLGRVPILGWYLHLAGHILVDRANRQRSVESLRRAAQKIRRGRSILIYPEGTRSDDETGAIRGFKKGAFMLAIESQVPVVPIAVDG
ncbi:MAG: lysophospholipid acyltransferase family protein, partial [Deltaproteobacteria bacterium]